MRHHFLPQLLLSIFLLILALVLFGISSLDRMASAVPLEIFISLIGIVLLTPIFQPEQDASIEEIVASKYTSQIYVYLIRIVYSLVAIIMLISLFSLYMRLCESDITMLLWQGAIANAMFLGAIGLLTSSIFRNVSVSYMVPAIYYALNFGGNHFGHFYLFSMMRGEYEPKIWLFVSSLLLMILSIFVKWLSYGQLAAVMMPRTRR